MGVVADSWHDCPGVLHHTGGSSSDLWPWGRCCRAAFGDWQSFGGSSGCGKYRSGCSYPGTADWRNPFDYCFLWSDERGYGSGNSVPGDGRRYFWNRAFVPGALRAVLWNIFALAGKEYDKYD